MAAAHDVEIDRRLELLRLLEMEYGVPPVVPPSVLRQLSIYSGQAGIYRDLKVTRDLAPDHGVAVCLAPLGRVYPDDLDEDGVVYHFPKTQRPASFDEGEILATKAAGKLGVPVFVMFPPNPSSDKRVIRFGDVVTWNDEAREFVVIFREVDEVDLRVRVPSDQWIDEDEFELHTEGDERSVGTRRLRPNQSRFRFLVLKRYGTRCAVCEIAAPELIDAAHLVPDAQRGAGDPRNALPLCANHHRAHDRELFRIEPNSLRICLAQGHTAVSLGITRNDIRHLSLAPHLSALEATWKSWRRAVSAAD